MWRYSIAILVLLMGYVWLGRTYVPFHGDEADHLYKSHDFLLVFVEKRPQDLRVTPPVNIDSPEHIRLLTGTVTAYLVGYALWSAEVSPWPGAWYYPQDVQWNIDNGRWPNDRTLHRGRIPTTILAMLSVPLVFAVTRGLSTPDISSWGAALCAAFLIATHPVWLLNSRRVMQEAALILLSLAVVALVLLSTRRLTWYRLLVLGVLSGLCVAAKPTGAITVGLAYLALGGLYWRRLPGLVISGLVAVGVYIIMTPAIWDAPLSRTYLAMDMRADVLRGQQEASPDAYDHLFEQAAALIKQPFLSELQYYESPAFEGVVDNAIADYERVHLDGWQMGQGFGWLTTGLAAVGLVVLGRRWRQPVALVGLIWIVGTGVALGLSVPLAWQRYYLLWNVAACVLAGLGFGALLNDG